MLKVTKVKKPKKALKPKVVPEQGPTKITIAPPQIGVIKVKVKGERMLQNKLTPEVVAKLKGYWDEVKKATKNPSVIKSIKKTEAEILVAKTHHTSDGKVGFPAGGFKRGMVNIAQSFGLFKTDIYKGIIVEGDVLPLKFRSVEAHHDMGKIMGKVPIPTLRPLYRDWEADLNIKYDRTKFTGEDVVNLVNHAGFYSGLGDWRPEKNGAFGQYHVAMSR